MAGVSPAAAHVIATDSIHPIDITASACDLSSCSPSSLGITLPADVEPPGDFDPSDAVHVTSLGEFSKLYIYKDGIVSFGSALPAGATLGDASSLGAAFAAPGFADYSGDDLKVLISLVPAISGGVGYIAGLSIYWTLDDTAIFGLGLQSLSAANQCASGNACFYHGSPEFSWWHDFATDPFLPAGAIVGFPGATHTVGTDLTLTPDTDIFATIDFHGGAGVGGVPEPAAWGLLVLGFGAIGAALRRRRLLPHALA